jgi:hypothetical protein
VAGHNLPQTEAIMACSTPTPTPGASLTVCDALEVLIELHMCYSAVAGLLQPGVNDPRVNLHMVQRGDLAKLLDCLNDDFRQYLDFAYAAATTEEKKSC